ncbi:MAG: DUF4040 domain-containing protein [Acidimicrobiales bacterium]|nr:DUF4040 domain-containing protein [Acidimicrobiales bacterium]
MAGLPPTLGFPAKEAAVEAALGLAGAEKAVLLSGVIAGSVLTVAYTTRLMIGLFGSKPDHTASAVAPSRLAMAIPIGILGVSTLAGFVGLGWVTTAVRAAAVQLNPSAEVYSLLRWPGLTTALFISTGIIAGGLAVGVVLARQTMSEPRAVGAQAVDELVAGVLHAARWTTGRVQHGSLPVYLVTMTVVATFAAVPFALGIDTSAVYLSDNGTQLVLAVLAVAGAVASTTVTSRLGAALALGAVGLAVAGLFVAHGAPDLALTQLLVETVVVVGFVLGLGHLHRRFPAADQVWVGVRLTVAGMLGVAVGAALIGSSSAPVGVPPVEDFVAESQTTGGGNNVVNVILTDMRALDTLGEIMVLVIVAVGILALAAPSRDETPALEGEPT